MSSAASQFPEYSQSADSSSENSSNNGEPSNHNGESSKQPLTRPTLLSPPRRRPSSKPADTVAAKPDLPTTAETQSRAAQLSPPSSASAAEPEQSEAIAPPDAGQTTLPRQQPISPPSEPMQYRAIGLVRGRYSPSEEQFNRGILLTTDGTEIDTVLLGRVTSLVKNHIDLSKAHLWVVYPRTRKANFRSLNSEVLLHLQIVGVWEPETLKPDAEAEEAGIEEIQTEEIQTEDGAVLETSTPEPQAEAEPSVDKTVAEVSTSEIAEASAPSETPDSSPSDEDEYFSIRGEVLRYDDRNGEVVINIVQSLKQPEGATKDFRVILRGSLSGKIVGYFWDLEVKRQGSDLVVKSAAPVAVVPPKKRKKGEEQSSNRNRRGAPPYRQQSPHSSAAPSSLPKPKPQSRRAKPEEAPEER